MPGGDSIMCFITDGAAQGYMDNFIHDCTFYIPRQAPNTLQADCDGFIPTNFSGCGDVAIASAAGCTISNCVFTTTLMANYTAGHHGDGIQSAGPWLRVMDSYFANIPNYTIFGDVTASSAHDIEVFNNVITYTDPGFMNSCCSYAITIGQDGLAPTAVISNVFVMNNTVVDGPHGIAIGSAENAVLYNNCWAVNNLCVNNTGVEGPENSIILPSQVTCLYNKAVGSGGVVPANLAGPANGNPVTFVSYTPYSANNDFHLAASDTGAIGNGTNWPAIYFGADKDGNLRPANGNWDIGAYEHDGNNVPAPSGPPQQTPQPTPQGSPVPPVVTLEFSNVVQTCTTKTKINHTTMTTNSVTKCKVSFDLVASNNGATNSPAFQVLLWTGQGSVFDPSVNPWPVAKRVKALEKDKTAKIKLTSGFNENQAGTSLYVTNTNNDVLAFVQIPNPA
jgi:hypothetical protein